MGFSPLPTIFYNILQYNNIYKEYIINNNKMKQIVIKKCLKCKYEWIARVKKPIQCPRCKSLSWNKNEK